MRLRISRKQAIIKYNMTDEEYDFKYIEAFLRFGLKRGDAQPVPAKANSEPAVQPSDGVTIKQLDELVKSYLGKNKVASQQETAVIREEFPDDSPEDARKRANGDLVRIDGFDVEHGFLRGYYGTDKDIVLPASAKVIKRIMAVFTLRVQDSHGTREFIRRIAAA